MSSENFKVQCDPFSNKKDDSQRSSCCQKCLILFLDIFQRNFRRWAWKNNNLKISLKSPKKWTVASQYCPKFVLRQMYRKTWFYIQNFLFRQNIKEKTNFFTIGPVVYAPGTQTLCDRTKKWTISPITVTCYRIAYLTLGCLMNIAPVHHWYLLLHPGVIVSDNRSLVIVYGP
jgi:hypothetical protein